jgi:carboxymethylenebutenolidase
MAVRIAARGFVVLAPDLYAARMIESMPVRHDPATEADVEAGIDALLRLPDVATSKLCLASHTRGGYYTLMVAVSRGRQQHHVACYVSAYPHWQDPNAPEPDQVYRYAPEALRLEIPTLIFMGEYEQYQRRRSIESAVKAMKEAGRNVRLIVYPGVGRGFDFRSDDVRTFADDLAAKDAIQRTAVFMTLHLAPWLKK